MVSCPIDKTGKHAHICKGGSITVHRLTRQTAESTVRQTSLASTLRATWLIIFQVIVENKSQPTLENLHEALGKAYDLPADRVWAVKHNWGKHEWVRLTRELGVKKVVR